MDPTANDPFRYLAVSEQLQQEQPQATVIIAEDAATVVTVDAPLNGEILPPEAPPAPAPETPPTIPQYPIGLIDFNQPIVVLDNADYNDERYDNPVIVTVLKGSTNPVVVSFWKHGEQCIAQFDTDGGSLCGDYKIEQDLIYPATRFVVIGRDGRNLVVDEELYASADAAREETSLTDIAGIFPVVIEAPKVAEPVPPPALAEAMDDFHEGDDESEEQDDEGTVVAPPSVEAPTEMYVAGRTRKVGETVHASRQGFGTRVCTIVKMRRDSRKSLYLDPRDGNGPYWALNKNVRY
jgi:hypothetical protein